MRSSPSRVDLRGNTPSSIPSRHTTRCGTDRIGMSVQIVRCPVRKFARVGRPCSRSASSARTSARASSVWFAAASRRDVAEDPVELGALPGVPAAGRRQRVDRVGDRRGPRVDRRRPAERVERRGEPVHELGEAARELDVAGVHVVERQHAGEEPLALLGHRDADEHAVEPRAPRPGVEAVEVERRAVRGVDAPADPAVGDPALDPREVVVVEVEAAADRLAVDEVEHLRGGHPLAREVDEPRDHPEHGVRASQRAVREPHAQVGRAHVVGQRIRLVVLRRDLAGTERRLDERREGLDVRAHHDHVAGLERRVVLEDVQDRVAQHLDLARAAVAGVDLDAAIAGVEQGPRVRLAGQRRSRRLAVGVDVRLDAAEQRVGRVRHGVVMADVPGGAEHELHLACVAAPRGQQAARRQVGRRIVRAAHDRRHAGALDPVPQPGRGVQEEEVHVTPGGDRLQDLEVPGGQPRQAEDAQPRREVQQRRRLAQPGARAVDALGDVGHADPRAQASPELGLPTMRGLQRAVLARRPAADHLGAVQRVAIEQLGEVTQRRQAPRPAHRVGVRARAAEVVGERREPRRGERLLDDLQQRPHRALGQPGVRVGLDPRRDGHRVADEPARRGERDVRAHPIRPPRRRAEPVGHPL